MTDALSGITDLLPPSSRNDAVTLKAVRLRRSGMSIRGIARQFNDDGVRTPRGKGWHATSIERLLVRYDPGLRADDAQASPDEESRRALASAVNTALNTEVIRRHLEPTGMDLSFLDKPSRRAQRCNPEPVPGK